MNKLTLLLTALAVLVVVPACNRAKEVRKTERTEERGGDMTATTTAVAPATAASPAAPATTTP